jgi:lipoprotein NlpD
MKKKDFSPGAGCLALAVLVLGLTACASRSPAPVVERSSTGMAQQPNTHVVRSGDTFYSIAREYGMDPRELIAINGSENPDQLAVGRVVRIGPRADSSATVVAPVTSGEVVVRPISDGRTAGGGAPGTNNTDRLKREPKAGKEPYSDQALATAQGTAQAPPPAEPKAKPAGGAVEAQAGSGDLSWIWPSKGPIVGTFSESSTNKGIDIAGKAGDAVVAVGNGRVVYSGMGLRGYGKLVIVKHNDIYLSAYAHNRNVLVKEGQSVSKGQKIAEMGDTDADRVKLHFEVRRRGQPVDPMKYLPPR